MIHVFHSARDGNCTSKIRHCDINEFGNDAPVVVSKKLMDLLW